MSDFFNKLSNKVTKTSSSPIAQVAQGTVPSNVINVTDLVRYGITDQDVKRRVDEIKRCEPNISPNNPQSIRPLLPRPLDSKRNKKVLVLDVDETLVHSSMNRPPDHWNLHLNVTVKSEVHQVYVAYRPFVQYFLQQVAPLFEVVIFTASVSEYCNPLMDALDERGELGRLRLFREHCCTVLNDQGRTVHVKDLSLLGRPLDQVAIVDNSCVAYAYQQRNAIPILSWFKDQNDTELKKLLSMLYELAQADTVYDVLDRYNAKLQLISERGQRM